jgi:hypothetical protein
MIRGLAEGLGPPGLPVRADTRKGAITIPAVQLRWINAAGKRGE